MNLKDADWDNFVSAPSMSDSKMTMPQQNAMLGSKSPPCYMVQNTAPRNLNVPTNNLQYTRPHWQQPVQFIPTGPPIQQQLNPQQQQWMQAQHKAFQEQKKMYDQVMKQRQFNEQKQRLKEFSTLGGKGSVTADTMIESILGPSDSSSRPSLRREYPATFSNATQPSQQTPAQIPHHLVPMYPAFNTEISVPITQLPTPDVLTNSQDRIHHELDTAQNVSQTRCHKALKLPLWLTDSAKLPPTYQRCALLVKSADGGVDTQKAYSLLLQSNLPPHLLGILWEMVNRTHPGCLEIGEFYGLLALIALVQKQKPFANADILMEIKDPVSPVIQHPSLQENIDVVTSNSENVNLKTSNSENVDLKTSKSENIDLKTSKSENIDLKTSKSDDEFADFVAAAATFPNISTNIPKFSNSDSISTELNAKLFLQNEDSKKMNLPSLGSSPKKNKNKITDWDDFNDFQSATIEPTNVVKTETRLKFIDKSQSYPTFDGDPEKDKYAVFRDLSELRISNYEEDNFGDFCSSDPHDTKDFVETLPSDTFEKDFNASNVLSISDPFGEFDEPQKSAPLFEFSSDSGSYVTANASVDTSHDADDDFGEFVKPTPIAKNVSSALAPPSNLGLSEIQAETQSVASLELPGLEMTVNLSEDLDPKVTGQVGSLADHPTATSSFDAKTSEIFGEGVPKPLTVGSSFSLADKYSSIRSEENQTDEFADPYYKSWQLCLEGCHKLLEEGKQILDTIPDPYLLTKVMATHQMREYLDDLSEVWNVSKRIGLSISSCATVDTELRDLAKSNQAIWGSILQSMGDKLPSVNDEAFVDPATTDLACCSLCLRRGGATVYHGSHSYHPPCANLWLNVVDLTLPALSSQPSNTLL